MKEANGHNPNHNSKRKRQTDRVVFILFLSAVFRFGFRRFILYTKRHSILSTVSEYVWYYLPGMYYLERWREGPRGADELALTTPLEILLCMHVTTTPPFTFPSPLCVQLGRLCNSWRSPPYQTPPPWLVAAIKQPLIGVTTRYDSVVSCVQIDGLSPYHSDPPIPNASSMNCDFCYQPTTLNYRLSYGSFVCVHVVSVDITAIP